MANNQNTHNYSELPGAQVPPSGPAQNLNPPVSGGLATVQNGPSKKELKSAAGQVNVNVPPQTQAKKPETSKSQKAKEAPKSNRKLIYSVIFLALLLLPIMPKQVGGEIEIEGTPAANQAILRPSIGGTVKEFPVKTGQEIRKGDTIAVLRNWDLEEKVLESEKQLARLVASVGPLRAQSRVAQEEYTRAREEYNRQKAESNYIQSQARDLKSQAAPPRIEATRKQLEQITLQAQSLSQKAALHKYLSDQGVFPKQSALQSAYEAASAAKQAQALSAQLKAEESELKQRSVEDLPKLKQSSSAAQANKERFASVNEEVRATYAQIDGLQRQIDLYKQQQAELVMKSPIDGVLLTLKTDALVGQNFNRGDTVAVVGDLSQVKIKLQLPEEERAYTKVGQRVTARFRAVPDQVFYGEVAQIAPVTSETGEQTNKRRIWEIVMVLKNPDTTLRPGMTGYAKISTGQTNSLLFLAWDEIYKAFRLDRYLDRNPFGSFFQNRGPTLWERRMGDYGT